MRDHTRPLRPLAPGQITTHWLDGPNGERGCWSVHDLCAIAEVERLRAELRASAQERASFPAPGHWYVDHRGGIRTMIWVGEIEDIDQARLRVALQAVHEGACAAVQERRRQSGQALSTSDLVMTVLDAVARALTTAEAPS